MDCLGEDGLHHAGDAEDGLHHAGDAEAGPGDVEGGPGEASSSEEEGGSARSLDERILCACEGRPCAGKLCRRVHS